MQQTALFNSDSTKEPLNWFADILETFGINQDPGWPDKFGFHFHNFIKNNTDHSPIRTLSLFSGGGGLDIAFHEMGFEIIECVEIEKRFTETLIENSKPGKLLEGSKITCVDIREYVSELNNIDLIIGGPPCQTFSAAGTRAAGVNGTDDKRGVLFEEYVRLLKQLRPKAFLFENVYRIVGAQGGKPWKDIQKAFKSAGYTLHWRILDAADYGVPQHRERLFIVGIKDGEFLFPVPTHGPDSIDNREYYTAGRAVKNLDVSLCKTGLTGRHGYLLNDIPPGLNYSFYTEKLGHPYPVFGWRSKFSDYLYKADPERPVRTIKAQGGQYTGPFSWDNRVFTIEELKRLQTFPDNYAVSGNRQIAIMQLGNSVPPQIGRILALAVLNQIFNLTLSFEINYLSKNIELGFRKRKSSLTKIYKQKANEQINKLQQLGKLIDVKKDAAAAGNISLYYTNNFRFLEEEESDSLLIHYYFSFDANNWRIEGSPIKEIPENRNEKFSIEIDLHTSHQNVLGTKSIELISYSKDPIMLSALWKFFERKIQDLIHKDDLIQLFGYYQYKQQSTFKFKTKSNDMKTDPFWIVTKNITEGIGINRQESYKILADLYDVSEKDFIHSIKTLKNLGYEIRNNNTNSQIKDDEFLIPYMFPTLNWRSLQRLTQL